jgi:hypothetical protein
MVSPSGINVAQRPGWRNTPVGSAKQAALALARQNIPVFPCFIDIKGNKRPTCPGGFRAATTDPNAVAELWHKHPGPLVGVPMGEASGLFLLDIDSGQGKPHAAAAAAWFADHHEQLAETLEHQTQSGGRHLLYRHRPGLANTKSKIAPGIDTKTDGGFAVWYPAAGFLSNGKPVAELPDWIAEVLPKKPEPARKANGASQPAPDERSRPYCRSALDGERARLAAATEGTRNDALNRAAFALGSLHHYSWYTRAEARASLHHACQSNGLLDDDGEPQFEKTFASGWTAGIAAPRCLPIDEAAA